MSQLKSKTKNIWVLYFLEKKIVDVIKLKRWRSRKETEKQKEERKRKKKEKERKTDRRFQFWQEVGERKETQMEKINSTRREEKSFWTFLPLFEKIIIIQECKFWWNFHSFESTDFLDTKIVDFKAQSSSIGHIKLNWSLSLLTFIFYYKFIKCHRMFMRDLV